MQNKLSEDALDRFIEEYKIVFANESQPTKMLLSFLRVSSYIQYESELNLIYIKKFRDRYEIVAHWCLANKNYPKMKNYRAFKEVLALVKSMDMPVVITNLNHEYMKATVAFNDTYRTR